MPKGNKPSPDKRKHQTGAQDPGPGQKGVVRPEAGSRAWSTLDKLQGAGKNISSRRKVPFGPVGGLGRKTNLSRSS